MITKLGGLYEYNWVNEWRIQVFGKVSYWKFGTTIKKANTFDKQKGFVWQNDWTSQKV